MNSDTRTRRAWPGWLLAIALLLAACGGGDADGADLESSRTGSDSPTSSPNTDDGTTDVDASVSSDGGEVLGVTSDRPDWLPVWVLLPEGIDIDASLITPGSDEAGLTGSVPNSDADELYNDALFMVQSAGYIISEEFEADSRGFTAEHTSDGSLVVFTVIALSDGLNQISWQFEKFLESGADAGNRQPAAGASDVGLEPLTRRGNLTISVTTPLVFSRIDGACDASNTRVQFLSDDGSTRFIVFTGDVVGAAGEITADFEGANVTWVAAADSEQTAAQTDTASAYYEGDFIQGSGVTFGVVQIACNE